MELMPLSDFVEKYTDPVVSDNQSSDIAKLLNNLKWISNYTKFLKQPLRLGMFVPCDENCNILEDPNPIISTLEKGEIFNSEALEIWNKAKERVMF